MMVAAGTSTPTSTTVVATRRPISCGGELRHHAVLLGALHLAVDEADAVAEALLQALEALGRVGEMIGAFGLGFLDQRANPVDQLARLTARGRPRRSPRRAG